MLQRGETGAEPTGSEVSAGESPQLDRVWATTFPELVRSVEPARAPRPRLLAVSDDVADELDLDPAFLRSDAGLRLLTGHRSDISHPPVAQVYAGHQWGEYRPILGDGRAALLGERRDRSGRLRDLHAKGIGPTPMSRVDGFADVGPMLREFVMTEAMHALGVPTTRALAVIATGAPREYDGRVRPGAVLVRTAASHVRFGTFEYVRALDDTALLQRLADHVIMRHFPRAAVAVDPYRALLEEIVDASAAVTADWMRTGFVHGVLSTDNVLVSGETIDYGPCAFLDAFDPGAVFSSIDLHGRYAYDRQPSIMRWNLARIGDAVAPLLAPSPAVGASIAVDIVASFDERYRTAWIHAFRAKLGLDDRADAADAEALAVDALALLASHGVDFTGFWRDLAPAAAGDERPVRGRFLGPVAELDDWLARWRRRGPSAARIRAVNPVYIPRNHIVEEALAAASAGDLDLFRTLRELVDRPYSERDERAFARYARPAPGGMPRHRTFCGT